MYLLHTTRLELQDFVGNDIPKYAILSHTWGDGEVLFRQVWDKEFPSNDLAGSCKIRNACAEAIKDGWEYIWVDTCCINKESSAELSEAINSMYQWYKGSEVCYVYLSDVSLSARKPKESRWFTRGWTLQELLAPSFVKFFDQDWNYLSCKDLNSEELRRHTKIARAIYRHPSMKWKEIASVSQSLSFLAEVAEVTRVGLPYLVEGTVPCASIAQKMSWVAKRETKRGEDIAYCMLGLLDVNMPLLYGEGKTKAFLRLQEELLKTSNDDSLFAWSNLDLWTSGLLAASPYDFIGCGEISMGDFIGCGEISMGDMLLSGGRTNRRPPSLTNQGIEMELAVADPDSGPVRLRKPYAIPLRCYDHGYGHQHLFLIIQFIGKSEYIQKDKLIYAMRTKVEIGKPGCAILDEGDKRQVYFIRTSCLKSSSWQTLKIKNTSWPPALNRLPKFTPPAVDLKLGHRLVEKIQGGEMSIYQDLGNLRSGPQRFEVAHGSAVTVPSDRRQNPCGLLLRQEIGIGTPQDLLLRFCRDGDKESTIEVLHVKSFDLEDANHYGDIQLPSKYLESWLSGKSISSSRRSGSAKILSRDLLRPGNMFQYPMCDLGICKVLISLTTGNQSGLVTIEIDIPNIGLLD